MNSDSVSLPFPGTPEACGPGLELVFHPPEGCAGPASAVFADAVRRVLEADATGEVCIVCPYLSAPVLEGITRGRRFRLVTDLDACFEARADRPPAGVLGRSLGSVRRPARGARQGRNHSRSDAVRVGQPDRVRLRCPR